MKAIVFDSDGTIVDTTTPSYEAWSSMYADYGCELALTTWVQQMGYQSSAAFELLQRLAGTPLDAEQVQRERRNRNRALLAEQSLLPGVVEWLREAAALGMACAIATDSPCEWVFPLLDRFSLLGAFTTIVSAEGVRRPKPDPEGYNLATQRLGVSPPDCMAVEDSQPGVRAAVAAGMLAVAVPNPVTMGQDFSAAHVRLKSLSEATAGGVVRTARRLGWPPVRRAGGRFP